MWALGMAVVRLPHPDSTFSKGRSPLVVEAPWVFSAMSSVPIRLGGGGGGGGGQGDPPLTAPECLGVGL